MQVIDDALPWPLFKMLQSQVNSPSFPWKYEASTAYGDDADVKDVFDFSWSHVAIKDAVPVTQIAEHTRLAAVTICKKIKLTDYIIVRARYGLITALQQQRTHEPHVDYTQTHKTLLLYINNTDGDTHFYDTLYAPGENLTSKQFLKKHYPSGMHTKNRVSPRENRAVVFDGLQYHSSSTPTKTSSRIVLNVNIFPEFGNAFRNSDV